MHLRSDFVTRDFDKVLNIPAFRKALPKNLSATDVLRNQITTRSQQAFRCYKLTHQVASVANPIMRSLQFVENEDQL